MHASTSRKYLNSEIHIIRVVWRPPGAEGVGSGIHGHKVSGLLGRLEHSIAPHSSMLCWARERLLRELTSWLTVLITTK